MSILCIRVMLPVLCLVALGVHAAGPPSVPDARKTPDGQTLTGRVVNAKGEPLKKARVFLYYSEGEDGVFDRFVGSANANRKGAFRFKHAIAWQPERMPARYDKPKYIVFARHEDGIGFLCVTRDDPVEDVTVTVYGRTTARFKVKDADGKPVEGALVFLASAGFPEKERKALDSAHRWARLDADVGLSSCVTGPGGEVELLAIPDAGFRVRKEGYAEGYYSNTDVVLFPSAKVSGTATYPDGAPAAGAFVQYTYQGERLVWSDSVLADAEGRFAFPDVPAAGFRYSWMDPQSEAGSQGTGKIAAKDLRPDSLYMAKSVSFPIKPGDALTQDVKFEKGAVFAGKVIDVSTNAPAPGMRFNIYIETGGRYLDTVEMKTGADGRFRTALAPGAQAQVQWEDAGEEGNYIIDQEWRNQGNWQPFRGTVSGDQEDLEFKVELWPVQPLQGKAVDAQGQPVKDATVHMHASVSGVKTDESGVFTLKTAPTDRRFSLYAETPERDRAGLVTLDAGTKEATIVLEPTVAREGQVMNTEGLPAAGLKFYADLRINDSSLYRVREEPVSDADGKFTLKFTLPKAQYGVFWSADNDENRDYDYGNAQFDLAALPPGEPIRFQARQFLNTLMGRVVNQKDEPVSGAKVRLVSREYVRSNDPQEAATNANGEFVLSRLTPGEAQFSIEADGYRLIEVRGKTDAVDLVAKLKPDTGISSIVVHVAGPDGKPVPGAPVALKTQSMRDGQPATRTEQKRADAQGVARFAVDVRRKPPVGGYLCCDLPGYNLAFSGIDPRRDAEVTLALTREGECWQGRVVDQEQKPVAGAKIRVNGVMGAGGTGRVFSSPDSEELAFTSGADGRFTLARIAKSNALNIAASCKDYAQAQRWLQPDPAQQDLVIQLEPGGAIKARVVLKGTNQPVPGMLLAVSATGPGSRFGTTAPCKDDGSVLLDGLPPGDYVVSCLGQAESAKKYLCAAPIELTLAARETREVELQVEEGVPVRGRATPVAGGLPKGAKWIMSRPANPPGPAEGAQAASKAVVAFMMNRRVPLRDDGAFELWLLPGEYVLQFSHEGQTERQDEHRITVEPGKPIEGIALELKE